VTCRCAGIMFGDLDPQVSRKHLASLKHVCRCVRVVHFKQRVCVCVCVCVCVLCTLCHTRAANCAGWSIAAADS
jgi:hypothetical protein